MNGIPYLPKNCQILFREPYFNIRKEPMLTLYIRASVNNDSESEWRTRRTNLIKELERERKEHGYLLNAEAIVKNGELKFIKHSPQGSLFNKVVCLASGGIDSSTLLYYLNSQGYELYPLTINYGQRHSKEIIAAENICKSLGLTTHRCLNLSLLKPLLPSTLTGKGEIPEGYYTDSSMSLTIVPNRNMIFLAIAAGYAQGLGASSVAYAAHLGDHPIYPDCRIEFVESASQTIKLGTGEKVDLISPFIKMTKSEIVSLGEQLKVPFAQAWSCYKGGKVHCGKCGTCTERKEAFILAKVKDPTIYEEE